MERFEALEDLINVLLNFDVKFHAGILNKAKLLKKLSDPIDPLEDFKTLLPFYFKEFESTIDVDNYTVILADGEPKEKEIMFETLQESFIKKCVPEQILYSANDRPILQIADAGLWIVQAYKRLADNNTSYKANLIRQNFNKLNKNLIIYEY